MCFRTSTARKADVTAGDVAVSVECLSITLRSSETDPQNCIDQSWWSASLVGGWRQGHEKFKVILAILKAQGLTGLQETLSQKQTKIRAFPFQVFQSDPFSPSFEKLCRLI